MRLVSGVVNNLLNNEAIVKMIRKRDKLSVDAEAIDDICPPEKISIGRQRVAEQIL